MSGQILAVGCSPGIYMCAIYLFTANIAVKVIHSESELEYECGMIAGLEEISKEKFNEDCKAQAKNMGINVVEGKRVEIIEENGIQKIMVDGIKEEYDYLVLDKKINNLKEQENVFCISDLVKYNQAIVVAGAGCKIAFKIKDKLN